MKADLWQSESIKVTHTGPTTMMGGVKELLVCTSDRLMTRRIVCAVAAFTHGL